MREHTRSYMSKLNLGAEGLIRVAFWATEHLDREVRIPLAHRHSHRSA